MGCTSSSFCNRCLPKLPDSFLGRQIFVQHTAERSRALAMHDFNPGRAGGQGTIDERYDFRKCLIGSLTPDIQPGIHGCNVQFSACRSRLRYANLLLQFAQTDYGAGDETSIVADSRLMALQMHLMGF